VHPSGIDPLAMLVEEHAQATRLAHLATQTDMTCDDNDNDEEDS
jgi:hypothetical protein